jgi:hypothetical protein
VCVLACGGCVVMSGDPTGCGRSRDGDWDVRDIAEAALSDAERSAVS